MVVRKPKHKRFLYIIPIAVVVAISIVWIARGSETAIVRGDVVDARSREPVYGASIGIANKVTFVFLDSSFELTHVLPGSYVLEADAPGYASYREQVHISQRLHEYDIALQGTHIPGLVRIYAFAESGPRGIDVEVRFANEKNLSIVHYPRLDISLRAKLYTDEQVPRLVHEGPLQVTWRQEEDPWKYWGLLSWDKFYAGELDGQYGVMELEVDIPGQGNYHTTIPGVELFR